MVTTHVFYFTLRKSLLFLKSKVSLYCYHMIELYNMEHLSFWLIYICILPVLFENEPKQISCVYKVSPVFIEYQGLIFMDPVVELILLNPIMCFILSNHWPWVMYPCVLFFSKSKNHSVSIRTKIDQHFLVYINLMFYPWIYMYFNFCQIFNF